MSSVNERSHEVGTSAPVFYRTYSRRKPDGQRETYQEAVNDRLLPGMFQLGNYTEQERDLLRSQLTSQTTFPSGRFMWVGGTEWSKKPGNVYGFYNCTSTIIETIEDLIMQMGLAMMGCGTGAVLLEENLSKLPTVKRRVEVEIVGEISSKYDPSDPREETEIFFFPDYVNQEEVEVHVGDSRDGWLDSVRLLLAFATGEGFHQAEKISIDLGYIRPFPSPLSGFGGVANPILLPQIYGRIAAILNRVHDHGGELTPRDVCLIIDECAKVVVAGNVRRSAGIRQFSSEHPLLKLGLWNCDDQGNWSIDPEKDALRMANHTRVWFKKPALTEIEESVRLQYQCGEGAIQYAPEAIRRANADIKLRSSLAEVDDLSTQQGRINWIEKSLSENAPPLIYTDQCLIDEELIHRANRFGLNPCFASGTMVVTKAGVFPIEQLVDKTNIEVYDGFTWTATQFKVTAQDQDVYKLIVSGHNTPECEIFATRHHKFILVDDSRKELKDLVTGDQLKTHRFFVEGRELLDASLTDRGAEVVSVRYSHTAEKVYCCTVSTTHAFALACGIMVGNCGEIIGSNFMCNLAEVHLNQIDPFNWDEQRAAFQAATLFAAPLLAQEFPDEKYRRSRELDPIVGVSFTGLFDFFVKRFGIEWLEWWKAGRPKDWVKNPWKAKSFVRMEQHYLGKWREVVQSTLKDYCDRNNMRIPNRCTTVQPSGTKSLLTGASPGWHPPKAPWFIRRITFGRDDAVARACMFYGYNVIPSQSDKDENGNLLTDPFDPRCTEWLVEIPTAVSWADTPGVEDIDVSRFPAAAQFGFYMQVQRHYATHNTSGTIELSEPEIPEIARLIHEDIHSDDPAYVSVTLLARSEGNASFPRLPFEPITKQVYEQLMEGVLNRRHYSTFEEAMAVADSMGSTTQTEFGPAGCDSDKCLLGGTAPG